MLLTHSKNHIHHVENKVNLLVNSDTRDIAAVANQILLDGPTTHHKQDYILTGPALISAPDMAASLTRQLDHTVRYLHLPGPIFGFMLRLAGADAWTANGVVAQFVEIVRPNKEGIEAPTDVVSTLR